MAPGAAAQRGAQPEPAVRATLLVAFEAIAERHLDAPDPADMALAWLNGLSDIDPMLSARHAGQRLELRFGGRVLASQARPASPAAAAASAARLLRDAFAASPAMQRAEPEAILAASFAAVFRPLDAFSRFVPASEAATARAERSGRSGLGLLLGPGPRGAAVVTAITPRGAAMAAGVRVGDEILTIDGVPVGAGDVALAMLLLDGPDGTDAVLRIRRGGRGLVVRIGRQPPAGAGVQVEAQPDGVLVLRVPAFRAGTAGRIVAAVAEGPVRGVILDLRGNGGGVLSEALAVADLFLEAGRMARSEGRHPDANRSWDAGPPDILGGLPLVVLVDGRTASAAEVLAAALAEQRRGAVVGSTTRGKGLTQIVVPLPGDAELHVSWARLFTPSGEPIEGSGVRPDICTAADGQAPAQAPGGVDPGAPPGGERVGPSSWPSGGARQRGAPRVRAPCPQAIGGPADEQAARGLIADRTAYRAALRR